MPSSNSSNFILKFRVSPIVGFAYRNFAKRTKIVFKGDGVAHRNVREKIKFLIRENPLNLSPMDLKKQIEEFTNHFVNSIVQVRPVPERGSLSIELRRENFSEGRSIHLQRIPNQTIFRAEKYIKELFMNVKDHPNAEIIKPGEDK